MSDKTQETIPGGTNGRRNLLWAVGIVLLVGALAAALYVGLLFHTGLLAFPLTPLPFDREQWLAEQPSWEADHGNRRYRMALELISTGRLRGLNAMEVCELLGPNRSSPYRFCYYLCFEGGPVIVDNCWLVLRLDDAGRVCGEDIWTD
ncbi:MAG: hypothetical protein GY725_19940 [bacterium]|nr:hypothetical protein [bacterium]